MIGFLRLVAAIAASAWSFAWAQPSDIPKDRLLQSRSIGVLSFAADYARIGIIGRTVFSNEHYYSPLAAWKLDEFIEIGILKLTEIRPALVQLSYDRQALFLSYGVRDLDAPMSDRPRQFGFDLSLIREELLRIAGSGDADLLLAVTKAVCDDDIGRTHQPLNGFGIYVGRRAIDSMFRGPGTWPATIEAYLCANILLIDPRKAEIIATRRVTLGGAWPARASDFPANRVTIYGKYLADLSEAHQHHILANFQHVAASVAASVKVFLGVGN